MAGLESITIRYLPGAEDFLHGHGESLVVDIRPEGIFSLGSRISAIREVPQRPRRPHARQWQLTLIRLACLIYFVFAAWVLGRLAPIFMPAGQQAVDPPCEGHILSSKTAIFPLSTDVSDLLNETVELATYVTFIGLNPHQHHRQLPGRDTAGAWIGGDTLQNERLWYGSLFNSATVPVVNSLRDLVASPYTADQDWQSGPRPPEILAREELLRLCQVALESLQEVDRAWRKARAAAGGLVLRSIRRSKDLGTAFTNAELHHMNDGAGLAPLHLGGGRPVRFWSDAVSNYSDPVWQHWVIDTTLERLFPPGLTPPPAGEVRPAVFALKQASAAALSSLTALENATSTWLYGVTVHEASCCNKFRSPLTLCWYLCPCAQSDTEDVQAARKLIQQVSRLRGYVSLATGQADTAMQLAYETVSGWDRLRSALQTVRDGNLHDPKVQAAVQAKGTNFSAGSRCTQQDGSVFAEATTEWAFEELWLLGKTVRAAALHADWSWGRVCDNEQALWGEGRDGGV